MEKEVTRKMIDLLGWKADEGDSIFTPGGAIANMYKDIFVKFKNYSI